jgi:hypothetical protein
MKVQKTPLTIALHGGTYLAIKIEQNEGAQTPLSIALHGGL